MKFVKINYLEFSGDSTLMSGFLSPDSIIMVESSERSSNAQFPNHKYKVILKSDYNLSIIVDDISLKRLMEASK